jgi:hypothetical protein
MKLYLQISDAINKDISEILHSALSGKEQKYRYEGQYIRWGLVGKDIHAVVERHLTADEDSLEA